jgi:uncharacterized protein YndB with AHSA1/START domain
VRYETSVRIDAAPERVWEALLDVDRWPTWTASMSDVHRLDGGRLRVGSRVRIEQPRLPTTVWRVEDLADGRSFTWTTERTGLRTVASHEVVADDGGGSRVLLTVEQTGPLAGVAGVLAGSLTRSYVDMEAQGLKTFCER